MVGLCDPAYYRYVLFFYWIDFNSYGSNFHLLLWKNILLEEILCITQDKRVTFEYRRARLDLGTSRMQYHAAELWNLLSDVVKNSPCRKYFKRNLCEKLVEGYSE